MYLLLGREQRCIGRPKEDLDLDDVEFLLQINFSVVKISKILGVSRSTIYRRLEENGRCVQKYSFISNDLLDVEVKRICQQYPRDGEVMITGHLAHRGIHVTRAKLRASIHRVDPQGVASRSLHTIKRRVYEVPYSNYVWHLDSHHKLIRWRIVIHAAIDGYSRKLMYASCANNNRANTVLQYYSDAVAKFGLPERVRSDKGGENVDVWRYTMYYQNMDSSSIIVGSSTHNQRIERLWCDIFRSVGQTFYELLYSLENEGILDPLNDVDLFCVHFTILPKIASCLEEFTESWNHHSLSTESNLTPEQLYTIGMIERQTTSQQQQHSNQSLTGNFNSIDLSSYGMDDTVTVDVPPTSADICTTLHGQLLSLQSLLGTEGINKNFGRDFYIQAIQVIGQHLLSGCEQCFQ